jgi:hypothetical protein
VHCQSFAEPIKISREIAAADLVGSEVSAHVLMGKIEGANGADSEFRIGDLARALDDQRHATRLGVSYSTGWRSVITRSVAP